MREGLDELFMAEALLEAERAQAAGEVPVGAVVVSPEGEILGRGHNLVITTCDPTAHAEINALRQAARKVGNYRLPGVTVYVTIEPCPMCAGALVLARVSRLVFGAGDPKSGACGSLYQIVQDQRLNHRLEVVAGVLENRCREIIQAFFRARR
ncbi:nucleoside deaminase [Thermosulfuriphilus ammonigenes]|uniref:tRNA-specific adenosine deaminase n=1 Tax=Thermosulfuriphilus ammonigenes TaxID=1936021 RepID=A0A6G7PVF5_9BACT|nr:tRNA adenosine(34) deaminase TadA [Thermosulfuriphilus ammonigenes]QIJ71642.1 nucleoside deaminase [Thermosulfuriphilus ammonigenes]HFB84057.1 nucleoside deaminase [Thermodesulfatator sp.]